VTLFTIVNLTTRAESHGAILRDTAMAALFVPRETNMRHQIQLASMGAAVAVLTALVGSSASAQSYAPTACTQEYAPVCAVRHGVTKIYPNRCVARSQGAHVVRKSDCSRHPVSVRG
jgi:hypothetical protein